MFRPFVPSQVDSRIWGRYHSAAFDGGGDDVASSSSTADTLRFGSAVLLDDDYTIKYIPGESRAGGLGEDQRLSGGTPGAEDYSSGRRASSSASPRSSPRSAVGGVVNERQFFFVNDGTNSSGDFPRSEVWPDQGGGSVRSDQGGIFFFNGEKGGAEDRGILAFDEEKGAFVWRWKSPPLRGDPFANEEQPVRETYQTHFARRRAPSEPPQKWALSVRNQQATWTRIGEPAPKSSSSYGEGKARSVSTPRVDVQQYESVKVPRASFHPRKGWLWDWNHQGLEWSDSSQELVQEHQQTDPAHDEHRGRASATSSAPTPGLSSAAASASATSSPRHSSSTSTPRGGAGPPAPVPALTGARGERSQPPLPPWTSPRDPPRGPAGASPLLLGNRVPAGGQDDPRASGPRELLSDKQRAELAEREAEERLAVAAVENFGGLYLENLHRFAERVAAITAAKKVSGLGVDKTDKNSSSSINSSLLEKTSDGGASSAEGSGSQAKSGAQAEDQVLEFKHDIKEHMAKPHGRRLEHIHDFKVVIPVPGNPHHEVKEQKDEAGEEEEAEENPGSGSSNSDVILQQLEEQLQQQKEQLKQYRKKVRQALAKLAHRNEKFMDVKNGFFSELGSDGAWLAGVFPEVLAWTVPFGRRALVKEFYEKNSSTLLLREGGGGSLTLADAAVEGPPQEPLQEEEEGEDGGSSTVVVPGWGNVVGGPFPGAAGVAVVPTLGGGALSAGPLLPTTTPPVEQVPPRHDSRLLLDTARDVVLANTGLTNALEFLLLEWRHHLQTLAFDLEIEKQIQVQLKLARKVPQLQRRDLPFLCAEKTWNEDGIIYPTNNRTLGPGLGLFRKNPFRELREREFGPVILGHKRGRRGKSAALARTGSGALPKRGVLLSRGEGVVRFQTPFQGGLAAQLRDAVNLEAGRNGPVVKEFAESLLGGSETSEGRRQKEAASSSSRVSEGSEEVKDTCCSWLCPEEDKDEADKHLDDQQKSSGSGGPGAPVSGRPGATGDSGGSNTVGGSFKKSGKKGLKQRVVQVRDPKDSALADGAATGRRRKSWVPSFMRTGGE